MHKQLFLFAILLCSFSAGAQDFLISTDSTEFPSVNLNEVRVVSSREHRNNKIVELPAAISVVNFNLIKQEEVTTLNDLSALVPNLFMPDYGTKLTSPIYLRGIGSRINAPSVGLYVDNVPYFEKAAFDFDFYDIQRIEVLRGPQGTLYGRNTMGGIINVYTREPSLKRETNLDISTGIHQYYKGMISHSLKLGEKSSFLMNASAYHFGGVFENKFSGENVDAINSFSGRLKFVSNLSRKLKLSYSLNAETSKQQGYPYAIYNKETGVAGDIDYEYESSYQRKILSNNLQLKFMADKFTFISNTSYQYLDGYQDIDQDFTSVSRLGVVQDQQQHMVSQEFTINSIKESGYSYLFGFFGFTQLFDKKVNVDYKDYYQENYSYADPTTLFKSYNNLVSGAALFHQSTFTDLLVSGLDVIAGIRLDMERAGQDYDYDKLVGIDLNDIEAFNYHLDFFEWMPKIAISYQCAPRINTYATVAKGYKSGGFNTTIERKEDESFNPESSINYEFGVKSDFFDSKLRANLALFYIDWDNQQIYQTVPSGRGSMIKNAGRSYSKGLEVELNWSAMKGLRFFTNMGFTEAKFIEYEKDSLTSYSDNYIPYVPKMTIHSGLNYNMDLKSGFLNAINFQLSYQGFGKIYWNEINDAVQDYYGLINSRLSFEARKYSLSIWAKNLFNADYHSFYFTALGNSFVQLGKPLMLGATVSLKI